MYSHILVALDGSSVAEQVLPHVEALAIKFGAKVTLVRATRPIEVIVAESIDGLPMVTESFVDPSPILKAEQDDATDYLAAEAKKLVEKGLTVDVRHPTQRPAEAIVEFTRDLRADLIAMTTHGRTGLRRALLGSVADAVVRSAPCPVLLVCAR
jgi:nucleotide-binding universal stress UspA family protein